MKWRDGNKGPCKGCVPPARHIGCHSTCKEYIEWKADRDKFLEHCRKQARINDAIRYSEERRKKSREENNDLSRYRKSKRRVR